MLASAPVFHKLFEVREVTCTVTVPLDSRIPLSGGVHGKVPCVGSVLQMINGVADKLAELCLCRAVIRQFPFCLCWWSSVQPLACVTEGRVTDKVLFLLQWAPSRRGSIPASQEWFLDRGNIKWNSSSSWNHQELIMSYLMLLWSCRNTGEHCDTSSWPCSAMVSSLNGFVTCATAWRYLSPYQILLCMIYHSVGSDKSDRLVFN